jgi:hypothetical protein
MDESSWRFFKTKSFLTGGTGYVAHKLKNKQDIFDIIIKGGQF